MSLYLAFVAKLRNQNLNGFEHVLKSLICIFYFYLYQYNAFRAKRREIGYTEEELKETYGFLLFDDLTKVQLGYTATPEKTRSYNTSKVVAINNDNNHLFKGSHTP